MGRFGFCVSTFVGYDTVGMMDGGNAMGVGTTFFRIEGNGGDNTLGDLKVTGYTSEQGENGVLYCQLLDGAGRTKGIDYWWYDFDYSEKQDKSGDEGDDWCYGWYNADCDVPYNGVELKAGDGVWIFSNSTNFKVQGAGAVPAGPVQVALPDGGNAKLVINPMPCELTFGDMWIDGYTSEQGENGVLYCQLLDGAGRTKGVDYWWYDFDYSEKQDKSGDEGDDWCYGWYNADCDVPYNTLPLPAGTGVWMFSNSTKFTANFKSPIQKDAE